MTEGANYGVYFEVFPSRVVTGDCQGNLYSFFSSRNTMEVEHEVLQFVERQRALLLLEKQAEADEAARYGTPRIGANRRVFFGLGRGRGRVY